MIPRYQAAVMKKIWSDQTKFNHFLKVELAASKFWTEEGLISQEEFMNLSKAVVKAKDVYRFEEITKHDVIAFTKAATKDLGDEKKWFHYGLTSTDVVDTAQSLTLKKVNQIIIKDMKHMMEILKEKAYAYKDLPTIGRTHGIHAEMTSFGLKFALWYEDFKRIMKLFIETSKQVEIAKLSGAVGNYSANTPKLELFVSKELKLKASNISTQTLQRDRHAAYLSTLALIGAELDKIATEIRHLSRTEVSEVSEAFLEGQKGSSAMPHKKNPIASENISGLSRVLKGYMVAAFDNISLWHERDISHSSVERIILADATSLVDYMLKRYSETMNNLKIHENRVRSNILMTHDVIFSQTILNELIKRNMDRTVAYKMIQRYAFQAIDLKESLISIISRDPKVMDIISYEEMVLLTSEKHYLRYVDDIFERVFHNK